MPYNPLTDYNNKQQIKLSNEMNEEVFTRVSNLETAIKEILGILQGAMPAQLSQQTMKALNIEQKGNE